MYEYVFFDLDGTLTDPFVGITGCVAYALSKFGIEVKVKREPRTPIWVLAARQASIEAMRLEAVIISIEKAEFNAIVR